MIRTYRTSRGSQLLAGIILLLVGIVLIVVGSVVSTSTERKIKDWPHVTAVVSDYTTSKSSDNDTMYAEVLQYEVNGRLIESKSNVSTNYKPLLNVKKNIAYNPDNPYEFVFTEGADKNLLPILLFVIGSLFTVIGASLLVSKIVSVVKKKKGLLKPEGLEVSDMTVVSNDVTASGGVRTSDGRTVSDGDVVNELYTPDDEWSDDK